MEDNKEIRNFQIELRKADDDNCRTIEGYALVFNSQSEDMGFREILSPDCLSGVLERSDFSLLINHNPDRGILGRYNKGKGSLNVEIDDIGLHFWTNAPNTSLGNEVLEYMKRGDMYQCSFAFSIAEDGDNWVRTEDGEYLRTINQIDKLYDLSVLTVAPAYEGTSCSCRSFEAFKEKEAEELRLAQEKAEKEAQEKREAEEREKAENLKTYYENIKTEYSKYLN